jgi:two-component system, LuxR family, response regulator FixJ
MAHPSGSIAVVDDDPSMRHALTRLLRASGFAARAYESAVEFLATLAERVPGCLIVDVQMPQMTGLQLHRHLTQRNVQIPTILMSGRGGEIGERCIAAGAVAFLSKPVHSPSLLAAIDRASRIAPRGFCSPLIANP